jgi:hypothetical protein
LAHKLASMRCGSRSSHQLLLPEYTSHHDFGYSRIDGDEQGARFATLLLYLNEDMVGGETSFPVSHRMRALYFDNRFGFSKDRNFSRDGPMPRRSVNSRLSLRSGKQFYFIVNSLMATWMIFHNTRRFLSEKEKRYI